MTRTVHHVVFVDSSRPTPCTGASDRTLDVSVFVPDGAGPSPVMLDRYVAGDPLPALLAVLTNAADDPHFAFDTGRDSARLSVPPCGEVAPEAAPDVTNAR